MSDERPFPDPEVLPPEEDDDQEEEGERPRRSKDLSSVGPNPGIRRRRRRRKAEEKEDEEEISERAMLIKLLGRENPKAKDILEIFDKSRQREGLRRSDFESSQRAFIFSMGAQNEKLAQHNEQLMDRAFGFMEKFNELYGKLQEAGSSSKAKEVVEVGALLLSTPIGVALQEEVLLWMKERREKREKKIQDENERLKRRLAQMEREKHGAQTQTPPKE